MSDTIRGIIRKSFTHADNFVFRVADTLVEPDHTRIASSDVHRKSINTYFMKDEGLARYRLLRAELSLIRRNLLRHKGIRKS